MHPSNQNHCSQLYEKHLYIHSAHKCVLELGRVKQETVSHVYFDFRRVVYVEWREQHHEYNHCGRYKENISLSFVHPYNLTP